MESVFLGTEVKFSVQVEAQGFNMSTDDFVVLIMRGHNVVKEYTKSDLIYDGDVYIMCIDTNETGVGNFDVAVRAEVPDEHFGDNLRTEIQRTQLMNVKKL